MSKKNAKKIIKEEEKPEINGIENANEAEETVETPEAEEEIADEVPEEETVDEAPVNDEKYMVYKGKNIIASSERELNGKSYKVLHLDDGSKVDLTEDEYQSVIDSNK